MKRSQGKNSKNDSCDLNDLEMEIVSTLKSMKNETNSNRNRKVPPRTLHNGKENCYFPNKSTKVSAKSHFRTSFIPDNSIPPSKFSTCVHCHNIIQYCQCFEPRHAREKLNLKNDKPQIPNYYRQSARNSTIKNDKNLINIEMIRRAEETRKSVLEDELKYKKEIRKIFKESAENLDKKLRRCSVSSGVSDFSTQDDCNMQPEENDNISAGVEMLIKYSLSLQAIEKCFDTEFANELKSNEREAIAILLGSIKKQVEKRTSRKAKGDGDCERKETHLASEHMRRNAINIGIDVLSQLIPPCSKKSKMMTIYLALYYILQLRFEILKLKEKLARK